MKNKEPIKYTIQNKNGIYEYSDSFEINDTVTIRIIILHPIRERNPLTDIVKRSSIEGNDIFFDDSGSTCSGYVSTVNDLRNPVFIKNTNDLKFELIENSKIQIMLLYNKLPPLESMYEPPYLLILL